MSKLPASLPPPQTLSLAQNPWQYRGIRYNGGMKYLSAPGLFLACLFLTNSALACDCPQGKESVEVAYKNADLVFSGEVFALEPGYYSNAIHATSFKPIHIYKGLNPGVAQIAIATYEDGKGCDLTFWEKRSYVVYATLDENKMFRASLCGRTTFLEGAEDEAAALAKLEFQPLKDMPANIEGLPKLPKNMPKE